MQLDIPYQNHVNKQILDYMLLCNNQLNNVNCSTDMASDEAKKDNHVFIIINEGKIYVSAFLSKKDLINSCYTPLTDVWAELQDIQIVTDDNPINNYIYTFDIKKFYSVLSFSSDYKNRRNISLFFTPLQDKIYYKISDNILVDLAVLVSDNKILQHIRNSYNWFIEQTALCDIDSNLCLEVDPVDKNSFLLPYANHKDCLNFAIADSNNCSMIYQDNENAYIECVHNVDDETLGKNCDFISTVLLRNDRFKCYHAFAQVSSGIWQILTILQGMKAWLKFKVFDNNYAILELSPNTNIYHSFTLDPTCVSQNKSNVNNFMLVGKLYANEVFTLNKLFANMKTSYFDFSLQKFIGTNYVFSDNKEEIKEVKLLYTCEENDLPLKITFTELKHYIGGDLSQKDFVLRILFDGINVAIQKWNNDETLMEYSILFNHAMSKKYLSL